MVAEKLDDTKGDEYADENDTRTVAPYIHRALEKEVLSLSEEYPVLLVTGPRQVGKTTMLRTLMEGTGRRYVSLDRLETRRDARKDPERFLQRYQPPLLIDEIQYAPELFTYLKIEVDARRRPGDYWLTGSQVFKLMRGVQESLAGRVAILHMSSLSQSEIRGIPSVPFKVDREALAYRQDLCAPLSGSEVFALLFQGSMPALVSGRHQNARIYYSSYLESYIERDVRDISAGLDTLRFLDFVRAAAARVAQTVNYAGLARDCGINEKTAKSWLALLETLGTVVLLHPYSNNALTRTVKSPKLYFSDTGLATYLAGFTDSESCRADSLSGALFENYVVSELLKSYHNAAERCPLSFYRDTRQTEIDLVLETGRKLSPLEIKQTASPGRSAFTSFSALDKTGRRGAGAVICTAPTLEDFSLDNLIVPVGLI